MLGSGMRSISGSRRGLGMRHGSGMRRGSGSRRLMPATRTVTMIGTGATATMIAGIGITIGGRYVT
jgi:hypothetical protein